jgi:hypothetical protein
MEATDLIRKLWRKHGNGPVREIDACSPEIGFLIQRGPFLHIVAHIGDRNIKLHSPIRLFFDGDSIIKIPCLLSINGERE